MTASNANDRVDAYIEKAASGEIADAIAFTNQLLESGLSKREIISDVLAPAQRLIGERWERGEVSVADEHLVTGVTESALYALATVKSASPPRGSVVVVCAPGDWHAVAGHMLSEHLQSIGFATAFLGASMPVADVGRFLAKHRPTALAVTCTLPLFFLGVRELVETAHDFGVPVIVGGRAFRDHPERARFVGADEWAEDGARVEEILTTWRSSAPTVTTNRVEVDVRLENLNARANEIAAQAFVDLATRFPTMASYTPSQLERTKEDLSYIVRFAVAALFVHDTTIFTEFLAWLVTLLEHRGVPKVAVVAGLQSLQTLPEMREGDVGNLLHTGLVMLAA